MSYLVICEICGTTFTTSSNSDVCTHCKTSAFKNTKSSYSLNKAKEARKAATSHGLKALAGTDKQKSWGESIRKDLLKIVDKESIYLLASDYFSKATFWIENRDNLRQLSNLLFDLNKAKKSGDNTVFVELRTLLDDNKVSSYFRRTGLHAVSVPKKTKKSVMTRAWFIAKEAATKFGGSSKLYFAQSLKMAWSE